MKKLRNSITFKSIMGLVLLLVVFSSILGFGGYRIFREALYQQYVAGAFRVAETAALAVNADRLDAYEENGGKSEDYAESWELLDKLCNGSGVTFIYVIRPDLPDYGQIRFLFSTVNHDSSYYPYEVGYVRTTTNEEYKQKYIAIYEEDSERELVDLESREYSKDQYHITAMIPLKDQKGDTAAILCVQRQLSAINLVRTSYVHTMLLILLAVGVVVIVGQGVYLREVLLRPLEKIGKEAARFAKENEAGGRKLSEEIRNKDEIGELAAAIDQMEEQIHQNTLNLESITAEKERISTELNLARRIQEAMLPHIFPPFPERSEFDLFATMDPAREVGGDFYDFFLTDQDHLCLVTADVSGKGIPAALFMMISKTILQSCAMLGRGAADILNKTNEGLSASNQLNMFITVWVGILEISTGRLTAASAGHEYPFIRQNGGEYVLLKDRHGPPVGIINGVEYHEYELQLKPGDGLFVYTDGVPEASNADDEMFGTSRMLETLNREPDADPEKLLRNMRGSVDAFVQDAEQFDDMTMLGFVYHGTEKTGMQEKLTIDAKVENLDQVLGFLDAFLERLDCPMKAQMQMDLAVEELFVNVASYAYGENTGKATLELMAKPESRSAVTLVLTDEGMKFNPLEKEDPDLTLPAEERGIGGLGILMVKKNVDEITYRRVDGKNILTMKKKL